MGSDLVFRYWRILFGIDHLDQLERGAYWQVDKFRLAMTQTDLAEQGFAGFRYIERLTRRVNADTPLSGRYTATATAGPNQTAPQHVTARFAK
jgi:hypothetical protein